MKIDPYSNLYKYLLNILNDKELLNQTKIYFGYDIFPASEALIFHLKNTFSIEASKDSFSLKFLEMLISLSQEKLDKEDLNLISSKLNLTIQPPSFYLDKKWLK